MRGHNGRGDIHWPRSKWSQKERVYLLSSPFRKQNQEGTEFITCKNLVKFWDSYDIPTWWMFRSPICFYWVIDRTFQMKGALCLCSGLPLLCGIRPQGTEHSGNCRTKRKPYIERQRLQFNSEKSECRLEPTGFLGTSTVSCFFLLLCVSAAFAVRIKIS